MFNWQNLGLLFCQFDNTLSILLTVDLYCLQVKLAVGSTDQFVNVYSSADSRKK